MKTIFKNKHFGIENRDMDLGRDLDYYLKLTRDFESSFKPFVVKEVDGFNVIDESEACPVGYKARAGEFLMQTLKEKGVKEVVYVQPRVGFAGISLSYLCKKYDMSLTLVMPASKEISDHQALCIELGAKPLFLRVAAMPNANSMAKRYAQQRTSREYVPLGLNHELVVAGGVRSVYDFFGDKQKPEVMWSVISTGVLTRSLQIALPDTQFNVVAVSRNIQQGELGRAKFYSYHKLFTQESDMVPTKFNSERVYDSKGWHYMSLYGDKGDWFFNVAGNAQKPTIDKGLIDSYRDWNDLRDFKDNLL